MPSTLVLPKAMLGEHGFRAAETGYWNALPKTRASCRATLRRGILLARQDAWFALDDRLRRTPPFAGSGGGS